MVSIVRYNLLASAVAVALIGGTMSPVVQAAPFQLSASPTAMQASADGVYIITFEEAGLLHYKGSVKSIAATAPSAGNKLDVNSASAQAYKSYLVSQRSAHVSDIDFALGRTLTVTHNYAVTKNGIAAYLSASEAAAVAGVPGVKSVRAAGFEHLDTYRGPKFIGADTIWSGANTPTGVGTLGKGVTIGVLDTGANSAHPSFANDTSCGFRPSKPKLVAVDCSVTDVNGFCDGPNPEAAPGNGHGPHTGSTAGGNTIDNTANPGPLLPNGTTMSGVAPCAAIISYKVCQTNTCAGADIAAAIENAIADGIDVINYSISGGTSPWDDLDRNFLDAVNAGIFIAASAGNTRTETPSPIGNVNHLGPWVLTVAASTQDQLIGPELAVTGPAPLPPSPPDLAHISLNPGNKTIVSNTTNIVGGTILSYPTNITGCTATGGFPSGYFANTIAVVRRGTCPFVEKITNASNAGAKVVVIANNQAGSINMDTTGAPTTPAFSISQLDGDALLAYVAPFNPAVPLVDTIFANGFDQFGAQGDYKRAVQRSRQGDVLADFSFRGPTPPLVANETKPDITGPGVDIYAALTPEEGNYGLLSGTSMSAPHLAGAAALVRAVHPNWTATEVKSAIMMTATNTAGVREDTITPWNADDVGSGRVDLTKAALAALTMDETYANYLAANPALSGDIRTLNLPALRDVGCATTCTWTRKVKNQTTNTTNWSVSSVTDPGFAIVASPASFSIAPGATQTITFTATPSAVLSSIKFGKVTLTPAAPVGVNGVTPMFPAQHITVAVKSPAAPPVPGVCVGSVCNLQIDGLPSVGGSFNSLGCGPTTPCQLLWLNQFKAEPAEFPITLNSVQTIFSSTSTTLGNVFDVYVYQDNDADPSNGATLVSTVAGQTITVQNALQTIVIPGGAVLNGPGDIIVALVNRTLNPFPAAADDGVAFLGKSWVALGAMPASPNLAAINLTPTTTALASFAHNWIIRAQGTNGGGRPITLSPAAQ